MRQVSLTPRTETSYAAEVLVLHALIPNPVRAVFLNAESPFEHGELMLWRDVAARLTLDAFGVVDGCVFPKPGVLKTIFMYRCKVVSVAREWFKTVDARDVFWRAGYGEVDVVAREVAKLPPINMVETMPRITDLNRFRQYLRDACGTDQHVNLWAETGQDLEQEPCPSESA